MFGLDWAFSLGVVLLPYRLEYSGAICLESVYAGAIAVALLLELKLLVSGLYSGCFLTP